MSTGIFQFWKTLVNILRSMLKIKINIFILTVYLKKSMTSIFCPRRMLDSFDTVLIPLGTNVKLRDR